MLGDTNHDQARAQLAVEQFTVEFRPPVVNPAVDGFATGTTASGELEQSQLVGLAQIVSLS